MFDVHMDQAVMAPTLCHAMDCRCSFYQVDAERVAAAAPTARAPHRRAVVEGAQRRQALERMTAQQYPGCREPHGEGTSGLLTLR